MKFTLRHTAREKWKAVVAGVLSCGLAVGFLVASWLSPLGPTARRAAGWMSMGSASCLLMSSMSLLLLSLGRSRGSRACAGIASAAGMMISALSLIDYFTQAPLGRFEVLHMRPNSALAFLLLSTAFVLLPSKRLALNHASQGLAFAAMALAILAGIGHLYGPPLFQLGLLGGMSVPAVVGVFLAGFGLFATRSDFGLPALFTSRGPGGMLARRLLLPVMLATIAFGWLVLDEARLGGQPASLAIALLVTTVAMLELSVGLVLATRLERLNNGRAQLLEDTRRAREALQEAEERLRLALQCGAIGAWQYDPKTQRVTANARCQAMFGLTPQAHHELESYLERVHPDDRPQVEAAMEKSLAPDGDGGYDIEYRVVTEPDGVRWIRATGQAFFDTAGQPERMIGTVSDITDHKLARQNAEAASRAKDAFLAVLGHELRNPLSPILTALELMKLRGDRAFAHERSVIERQVQHMVRLVDDLLDVSRIARGKVELKRRHFEIATVIERSIELTSPLFEQRRHMLRVAVPQRGLVVYGDEHRLIQVVSNLLTNAGKYTQPGGAIDISARANGERVQIAIKDNGVGISDQILPHVFDDFTQGPRIIERSQGGLGLGLSIAKSLIELHGGTIAAKSAAGSGSEFTVSLPLELGVEGAERTHEAPSDAGSENPAHKHVHRVLVVDDNPDTAETLAEILRFDEHEVSVAYDGPGALALAQKQHFDLAFLDIGLPVMDGYELARKIRDLKGGDELVLVAVTGYGRNADRRRSEAAGFNGHLVKPVEPVQVLSIASEPAQASLGL